MYIVLAVVSNIGAVFITVPYSVLGGTQIMTAGIFIGVVLSNLQYVDLGSTRNLAIIGISLLTGLMIPYWVTKSPDSLNTGSERADRNLTILLSNPVFVGGFLACFLDSTVPGTQKERGILADEGQKEFVEADSKHNKKNSDEREDVDNADDNGNDNLEEGMEVYDLPWLPRYLRNSPVAKFLRIFPARDAIPSQRDTEAGDLFNTKDKGKNGLA